MTKPTKLITEILPTTKSWTVKVMVTEKTPPRASQHSAHKYQRLILVDSEGTRIQGSIFGRDIDTFKDTLIVSECYRISNAYVKPIKQEYRIVENEYQWTINNKTLVQDIRDEEFTVPLTFNFVPFADLDTHKGSTTQVDIIAIAIDMQAAHQITTRQGQSTIQELIVINQELKPMVLTMWNQFVDNEAAQISQLLKTRPIIIATHLKVVSYNGTSLATKSSSSFIINPDTSEAVALHSWSVLNESILEDIIKNKPYMASASSSAPLVVEDVVQIAKIGTLLAKETNFWVKASMRVKNLDQKFWYMSCNQCNKITGADYEEAYTCIYCKSKNAKALPRCCVEVELQDTSDTIVATIFGKNAEAFMSCSAKELMEQTDEDGSVNIDVTLCNPNDFFVHIRAATFESQGQRKNKFNVVALQEIPNPGNNSF